VNLTYKFLDPAAIIDTEDFKVVQAFLHDTGRRNIGWHYIIDLTWIYSRARLWPAGMRVLDAGGGRGPAQFLLAEMGFDIVNLDLMHTPPDYSYTSRYGTKREGLKSNVETRYLKHILNFGRYLKLLKQARKSMMDSSLMRASTAKAYAKRHENWRKANGYAARPVGRIQWLVGNLCHVPELKIASFDAVVSLSSLEHIPIERLPEALVEMQRLVKPDGHWVITTSGTERAETWYHDSSLGYCFSEGDLSKIFRAQTMDDANPETVLQNYQASRYLRDNLAFNYRLSGQNGMPWGKWNPVYIPVGISELPPSI
jgi:2-polyprenyl-3-methyl-5-hydroxy-6-metoxy-1,4-benzoquinol methylase